ncbi:hypothetical protein [Aliarcobacter cibarius]|uniref:DNA repair protein Rad50 n=1 Tax=Aliarcobacter cibarius TaxID=255507 RepID=A0A7L5JLM8_9BACT|nr:hypothetical protein [Aliarcobacter cibarius]QKJ26072.1 hypothetical protein ACBT_0080 [Aliarcobacter cibarius]TLS96142.1 hypothetical protein FE247_10290 [Aliarcobacter cibarius]TLS97081.1 hypothetical protein FE245_09785 [Aliarcobacter cibarius]TLT02381.1 hypothetical protein FE248_10475 [Aliarcobacter cibarius]
MINIKIKLKDIIEKVMIPESKTYLNELNEIINNNEFSQDDLDAKEDMKSFLQELQAIIKAIDKNEINDDEAKVIYEKINYMLQEHEENH